MPEPRHLALAACNSTDRSRGTDGDSDLSFFFLFSPSHTCQAYLATLPQVVNKTGMETGDRAVGPCHRAAVEWAIPAATLYHRWSLAVTVEEKPCPAIPGGHHSRLRMNKQPERVGERFEKTKKIYPWTLSTSAVQIQSPTASPRIRTAVINLIPSVR